MGKITIFKNISETNTPFFRNIEDIFKRIRIGVSKKLILRLREEKDKEKSDQLKRSLPAILFAGTFTNRSTNGFKDHSGFICLDFDKYDNDEKLLFDRKLIEANPYTYAVFTSPSGNGMKVIVKILPDKSNHKNIFKALGEYYNLESFDYVTSDISRACFESFDPEIYINDEALTWNKFIQDEGHSFINSNPIAPLENEDEIVKRLMVWFNSKYSMTSNRNNNLYILASAFNEYGIHQENCYSYLLRYQEPDFTEKEINAVVRSAYNNKLSFNTKFFDDVHKIDAVKNDIKKGISLDELKAKYKGVDIDKIAPEITESIFWFLTKHNKIGISNIKYKYWLQGNGFFKYFPEGSESFILIRIENNVIDTTTEVKIKDFVLAFLLQQKEGDVYQYMTNNPKYFKDDYLNTIDVLDIKFKEDTPSKAYLYFKSSVVEIMSDKINVIDYIDLDGFVWKKQIINHEYKDSDYDQSIYYEFIKRVSSTNKIVEEDRFNSIISVIGYLMHSHKTSANNKAIIINDETISDNPNGGSGKGIFCNALKYVKKVDFIDGKVFNFEKNFAYQTLNADTQVLVFDDVQNKFNFESLFSVITEGITIEKKNKDAIKIPVSRSPKIVITTNYTIGGSGGSHERRKFEIEFSSFFNANHTPEQEFGGLLFDSWNAYQWECFYSFMIASVQFYLINGLVKYTHKNLEIRKLIKETSSDFIDFVEEQNIQIGERYYKSDLFDLFIKDYSDYSKWLKQKRFKIWLDIFFNYKKLNIEHGNDIQGRYFIITNK